ncbi:MAG: hypothetical protein LAT51_03035 [Flavobacteriaceae bacterium]|nr:hypothetical protein [Flavobacteriaceae bacterium]
MYDYFFRTLELLENEIPEMQDFKNYALQLDQLIQPYMIFDDDLELVGLEAEHNLTDLEKQIIKNSIWKTTQNRKFKVSQYQYVNNKIEALQTKINTKLDNN